MTDYTLPTAEQARQKADAANIVRQQKADEHCVDAINEASSRGQYNVHIKRGISSSMVEELRKRYTVRDGDSGYLVSWRELAPEPTCKKR